MLPTFEASMLASKDFDFSLAFGVGAGLFIFFKGFRIYREYLVVKDTPEISIRSIPMGLVEIHGKANGEQEVRSPVTGTPCLFYKVDVERWVQDKDSGHWSHYKTDADGPLFYLEDTTGKTLVNAHEAEFDLIRSGRREIGGWSGKSLGQFFGGAEPAPGSFVSDAELSGYVARLGSGVPSGPVHFSADDSPEVKSEKARMSARQSLDFLKDIALGGNPGWSASSRYRLTEYLILPGHWYDLTGTCVENPKPKDEHDRNLIVKGRNDPTFLISWRSEKSLESNLRKKAALHVLGGAALAVGCLVMLLSKLGML
jgi:hypothetical protein